MLISNFVYKAYFSSGANGLLNPFLFVEVCLVNHGKSSKV